MSDERDNADGLDDDADERDSTSEHGDDDSERGDDAVIAPLVVEFDVDATVEHAFVTWVERGALWWPPSHTMGDDLASIVFEPRAGGRIYERAGDGTQREWGEIVTWEPPTRVRYWWHLFFARSEATLIELTFRAVDEGTRVRLEQTGWDALGDAGRERRERTNAAWATIAAAFGRHVREDRDAGPSTPAELN